MRPEPADYEKLFFMLKEDPEVYPRHPIQTKGYKRRSEEELTRAVKMNLAWADKLVLLMIKQACLSVTMLKEKIDYAPKGLDSWL